MKKDTKIGSIYTYPKLYKYEGLQNKTEMRNTYTYIGLEIELEGVKHKYITTPSPWRTEEDHSLKDNGFEFITKPIKVMYVETELYKLKEYLADYKISSRCSVHVHLNVRDLTFSELYKLLALYMVFERSLYRVSGDRWNNNFCVPITFFTEQLKKTINYYEETNCFKEHWYKYTGLNLAPIFGGESTKIGTIEFRHMEGTMDIDKILLWINLIVSLKVTAKKLTKEQILNYIKTMNTTSAYYWLTTETFKQYRHALTNCPTFKQDVESSIAIAKSIFLKQEKSDLVIPINLKEREQLCAV